MFSSRTFKYNYSSKLVLCRSVLPRGTNEEIDNESVYKLIEINRSLYKIDLSQKLFLRYPSGKQNDKNNKTFTYTILIVIFLSGGNLYDAILNQFGNQQRNYFPLAVDFF